MSDAREQHTLRLVTFPKPPNPAPCTGSYTCSCTDCETKLQARLAQGVRNRGLDQPWSSRRVA